MKDIYKGKIKVPFCVNCLISSVPLGELSDILFEISGEALYVSGFWDYYGITASQVVDCYDTPSGFGENTTVYTLGELKAIIDEVKKGNLPTDTETLVEDGWVVRNGDECPVPPDAVVGVKLSNGEEITTKAFLLNWSHQNEDSIWYNIEKYKIITPTIDFSGVVSVEEDDSDTNDTTTIKTNVSFDITIKGKTFTLNSDELRDLYNQLCSVEGELQEWSLG